MLGIVGDGFGGTVSSFRGTRRLFSTDVLEFVDLPQANMFPSDGQEPGKSLNSEARSNSIRE